MPKELKTVDGATLMAARLPPIRYMIEGLLPQSLHLLAGAPKVGKSWLALWLLSGWHQLRLPKSLTPPCVT